MMKLSFSTKSIVYGPDIDLTLRRIYVLTEVDRPQHCRNGMGFVISSQLPQVSICSLVRHWHVGGGRVLVKHNGGSRTKLGIQREEQ